MISCYRTLARGLWQPAQVPTHWSQRVFQLPTSLQAEITAFWQALEERGHYNGRMARLDGFDMIDGSLQLNLSTTDYKTLLFSNAFAERMTPACQPQIQARALGLSVVVKTRDHRIAVIQRSATVGEYPDYYDVFGGHIDAALQHDRHAPFTAMEQELEEEAALARTSYELKCYGLIETLDHGKPELLFIAECKLSGEEITRQAQWAADRHEYRRVLFLADDQASIERFLRQEKKISPSAIGCLQEYLHRKCQTNLN